MSMKQSEKEESKLEKIKQLFGIKASKLGSGNSGAAKQTFQEFILTPDLVKDIGSSSPTVLRLKALKELSETVQTKVLEQNGIEVVWECIKDLLKLQLSDERHVILRFLICLIKGQYDHLGIMRAVFFKVIHMDITSFDDLNYRLELLQVLSSKGKELEYFEEEMGFLLQDLMKDVMSSKLKASFYQLLINMVKFNAAYLDEDVINTFVLNTCAIASNAVADEEVEFCLKLLEAMISFCYLPLESLCHVLVCLCGVVNRPKCSLQTWQLMRKLLGTHLGHSAIYTMCSFLCESSSCHLSDESLLRGAVYFIGMALWGSKRVPSLRHPPSSVLPSFLEALVSSNSDMVTLEIVLSTTRLVTKYNEELPTITWDLILDIAEASLNHVERSPICPAELVDEVHKLLTEMEGLYEKGQFYGPTERLFAILESCFTKRPEKSVMCLIGYRIKHITPAHDNWLHRLKQLIEIYFRKESRTSIRIWVLEILTGVVNSYKDLYQDELIETVVLPHMTGIHVETDSNVKRMMVQVIIDLAASSTSGKFYDLLEILKNLLNRPLLTGPSVAVTTKFSEGGTSERVQKFCLNPEIKLALSGVLQIFRTKLHVTESNHALCAYQLLVDYLRDLMKCHFLLSQTGSLRKEIIDCLMDIRVDDMCHVGILNRADGNLVFSPYVCCFERKSEPEGLINASAGLNLNGLRTVLSFDKMFDLICLIVETERDWNILQSVLEKLPLMLQNKMLLSSVADGDIERLAMRMCRMLGDRKLPEQLINCPNRVTKSDFHAFVFPVITSLVSFRNQLDKNGQVELVRCLEFGLVSKCAISCIRSLTVCALEMQNTMMRQLPSVLLKLSQICATVAMAVPLMEFLSSLIHLPEVYCNFVEEQYKSVFAIALPYTNPFKYSHYTVSLAYHVIAVWFIKCRLPLRRRFVVYIVKGLKSNVLRHIEESETYHQRSNQDSSDRNRTHSLNEEALRKKAGLMAAKVRGGGLGGAKESSVTAVSFDLPTATIPSIAAVPDQSVAANFHKELRDTCVDMLSRYAYFTSSSISKRSPVASFLLSSGQSQSWLISDSIVTITTSGGSKVGKSGLCEKCLSIARATRHLTPTEDQEQADEGNRRRHKSAAIMTIKLDTTLLPLVSQDDMSLNRRQLRQMAAAAASAESGKEATVSLIPADDENINVLQSSAQKIQAVDNVLMGLKAKPLDKSVFTAHMCNCWCTQWAEVHIRRATGNFSWMMRIQNEQDLTTMFPDFILSDISNLFKPFTEESAEPRKIDSSSLEEKDYIQMLEEFFHSASELRNMNEQSMELKHNSTICRSHSFPDLHLNPAVFPSQSHLDSEVEDSSALEPQVSIENLKPVLLTRSLSVSGSDVERRHVAEPDRSSMGTDVSTTSCFEATHTKKDARPRSGVLSSVSEESDLVTSTLQKVSEMKNKLAGEELHLPSVPPPAAPSRDSVMHGGINPTFLFLQLFYNQCFTTNDDAVLMLPNNEATAQSLKMLDMIFPYETHKIGVIYVKPGQTKNELAILSNMYGSTRYMMFLQSLGQLLRLSDCNPLNTYLGGLDTKGTDGQFAYAWHADFMQVIFHVITLMPFIEHDKQFTEKKKHIGNDFVTIVYNDSDEDYQMGTIKGQFNFVNIIIKPLDHGTNEVTVQTKPEIEDMIAHRDTKIISDANLGLLVRQMAVHANLASTIYARQTVHPLNPYASNWLERLRRIKQIRDRLQEEKGKTDIKMSDDFSIFSQYFPIV